ncbi:MULTISPECIES: TetR/AcrR family transcriptional regulator [unclassified Exiguobacterium]|uniref:TetR/AcrR family transcriptional regulator n=1 Tax=unclassified Exiguobacterium TaxID=2644629 RepID=UPI0010394505|nr:MULTISPECIES: TetR/AcrR family transcriptional regulator [unclassified Exiguobacterium]TCI59828.1 TetR/AcrR family transcriptional regulator [Exiguobacterium sp. SH0S2]TCI76540.1 TetR/AcrR family transcriptional regulator [Exiguobacterium sp. SH0S1]
MTTKQRIEQAARRRFALEGYEGLSLAALAEDVGIKKASLYAHIDGKEQLFKQVVEQMAERYQGAWSQARDASNDAAPLERIETIVEALIHFFEEEETWMLTKRMLLVPPPELRVFIETTIGSVETELQAFEKEQFRLAMERGDLPEQSLDDVYDAYYCFLDGALLSLFSFATNRAQRQHAAFKIFKRGVGWT